MGQFKIEITAMGGHGCDRQVGDGREVVGCGYANCPDCSARELIAKFLRQGIEIESATLTHWPGTPNTVVDDLLTKKRKGSFVR